MEAVSLLDRVRKTITRYNMLPAGSRVAVAASGGPDSTCLLLILHELSAELKLTLSVAHLNHRLRGRASDGDQRFVENLAQQLELKAHIASEDVGADGGNVEAAGRKARRHFFQQLREQGHADLIAMGHTRDDQAETVLFRMLRGAGTTGLAGIHPVTKQGLIRPLFEIGRDDVEEFLRVRGVVAREDESNQDLSFARNRIRHSLLPSLERDWNPQLKQALTQMADVAWEEERWWEARVAREIKRVGSHEGGSLEAGCDALIRPPRAVARRLVRGMISAVKGDLNAVEFDHVERILDLAGSQKGEGGVALPSLTVTRSFDLLRFAGDPRPMPPRQPVSLSKPGSYTAWDGSQIHLAFNGSAFDSPAASPRDSKDASLRTAEVDVRLLSKKLELRGWQAGDRYQPAGEKVVRSLQELFQKAKIPSWHRPLWPIVTMGHQIVWAKGFGAAAQYASGRESGPVLRIWLAEGKAD